MDIKEFKKMLLEGVVNFTYLKRKADGSTETRPARGTMKPDLLPKSEPIVAKFQCRDIVWDFDNWGEDEGEEGDPPKLRRNVKVALTQADIDRAETLDDAVIEKLEQKYGRCVKELDYYEIEKADETERETPDGNVFYFDLDKNGFRSFKFENLIQDKETK